MLGGELGRDPTLVAQVLGEVDRRHPARAKLALDAVPVSEGGAEPLERVGHGHARGMRLGEDEARRAQRLDPHSRLPIPKCK